MAKITELPSDDDSPPATSNKKPEKSAQKPLPKQKKSDKPMTLTNTSGVLYINYILLPIVMIVLSVLFLYFTQKEDQKEVKSSQPKKGILMTATELSKHDGSDPSIPIYIAILGRVYDVDKGKRHYGKDSGYNVFAGRDSTPSFVTGQFSRDKATDDVTGLSPEEMLGIKEWMDFYRKDYTYIGKVIGRYYDENGSPTPALKKAKKLIKEGKLLRDKQKEDDKKLPPCNSKWSQNEGSEVWCSTERYVCFKYCYCCFKDIFINISSKNVVTYCLIRDRSYFIG